MRWKRVVALAIYLLPRDGELRALRLGDVDLEHGTIPVHHSWDRRARCDKSTKSKRARRFSFEPTIAPLLAVIADEANSEHVASLPSERDMSRGLRRWLTKAGVARPELFTDTPTSRSIRFHDLRATGITWMAIRVADEPGQNDEGTEDCSSIPSEVAQLVAQGVTQTAISGRFSWRGGRDSNPRPPA